MDIKGLTLNELKEIFVKEGLPSFRAEQIFHWIFRKKVDSFQAMTNLPKGLIHWLESIFSVSQIACIKNQKSQDGSEKFLFRLSDSHLIESVLIKNNRRNTICLSSQVGCIWHCLFCASGKDGFKRNLFTGEILNQILSIQRMTGETIHNIVFMGMGEPFDNYDNVMKSIQIINSRQGINIGARKITISTCGIIPGIRRLTKNPLQIELSVSLHAAEEDIRTFLMPVNQKYPLKRLIDACSHYIKGKNRQITFEYMMLKGINDTSDQAKKLCRLISGFDAKVNLIIYNPIPVQLKLLPSNKNKIASFQQILKKNGIPITIRYSQGKDIQAACGQLRSHYGNKKG